MGAWRCPTGHHHLASDSIECEDGRGKLQQEVKKNKAGGRNHKKKKKTSGSDFDGRFEVRLSAQQHTQRHGTTTTATQLEQKNPLEPGPFNTFLSSSSFLFSSLSFGKRYKNKEIVLNV
jgi:hypothetical protein